MNSPPVGGTAKAITHVALRPGRMSVVGPPLTPLAESKIWSAATPLTVTSSYQVGRERRGAGLVLRDRHAHGALDSRGSGRAGRGGVVEQRVFQYPGRDRGVRPQ